MKTYKKLLSFVKFKLNCESIIKTANVSFDTKGERKKKQQLINKH